MTGDTIDADVDRARQYGALALAFDRPGEELSAALDEGTLLEALSESDLDGIEALGAALPEDTEKLRRAYARAFGNENESLAPQYELAYSPGTLVTETDRLADLAGFYRAFGLDVAADRRDRVDYLSTQLEFAAHLAAQRAYLGEEGDRDGIEVVTDARAAFVEDHLGRWVPRFAEAVHEEVDEPFYRSLAGTLESLVEREAEHLDVSPDVFEAEPAAPLESLPGVERDEEGRLATSCGAIGADSAPQPNPGGGR